MHYLKTVKRDKNLIPGKKLNHGASITRYNNSPQPIEHEQEKEARSMRRKTAYAVSNTRGHEISW